MREEKDERTKGRGGRGWKKGEGRKMRGGRGGEEGEEEEGRKGRGGLTHMSKMINRCRLIRIVDAMLSRLA